MSQELHVLRCYSCQTFQVHIVKKSNKWECKMCGEKQSVKKVYGRGSGRDCRLHVQHLNEMHMKQESLEGQKSLFQEESYASYVPEENARYNADESDVFNSRCSKWARFLDERGLEEPDDTVTCSSVMSTTRLITETPKNTYKTAAKEKSEIKEQTSHLPLLNSSEQETVFYDGINKVFHTNMDTTSVHQNMDSCFLSDEENQPNELCRKEYVENPSIEVQQGISTNLGDRNSESVQLPTIRNTYPPLRHVPAQCNSINTSTKLQKVLHPEFKLMGGDSEDELDNILSF